MVDTPVTGAKKPRKPPIRRPIEERGVELLLSMNVGALERFAELLAKKDPKVANYVTAVLTELIGEEDKI